MRPYLITAKLMRPSNMKRFPTPDLYSYLRKTIKICSELRSRRKTLIDLEYVELNKFVSCSLFENWKEGGKCGGGKQLSKESRHKSGH
jgi:hypothetical protein